MKKRGKGDGRQQKSDIIKKLLPILILLASGILLLFLADYFRIDSDYSSVQKEKDIIAEKLMKNSDLALLKNDGVIEKESLDKISSMDYYELKSEFGVNSDFSFYFIDSEGNVIPINGKNCIGSPKAKVAGQTCG